MSERRWTIGKKGSTTLVMSGPDVEWIDVVPASDLDEMRKWATSAENPLFDDGWQAGYKRASADLDRYRELAEGLYEALKEAGIDLWPGDATLKARDAMERYEATREPEGRS